MEQQTIFQKRHHCQFFLTILIAIWIVFFLGCASVNQLREAQDTFNQAAAAENAQRFDQYPAVAVTSIAAARSSYASVLLSLGKIDNTDKKQLIQDKLWGTVLTLKALCQWRLGQYDQALKTNEEAKSTAADQLFPRDRAILEALPGLIKTDQAYDKILNKKSLQEISDLLIGAKGAIADIDNARISVDKDHPVQIYLIQAQLAVYRNYEVALKDESLTNEQQDKVKGYFKELDRLLKKNSGSTVLPLVAYWSNQLGILP